MCDISSDKTVHARHIKIWANELVWQADALLKRIESGEVVDSDVESQLCDMANDLDSMAHGSPLYRVY